MKIQFLSDEQASVIRARNSSNKVVNVPLIPMRDGSFAVPANLHLDPAYRVFDDILSALPEAVEPDPKSLAKPLVFQGFRVRKAGI